MKNFKTTINLTFAMLALAIVTSSCDSNPEITPSENIIPGQFTVDIPNSISNPNLVEGRYATGGRAEEDLSGNDIYQHLGLFIAVGEQSAKLVEAIMIGIRSNNIDRIISLSYVSDDDGRVKNLIVEENVAYEGTTWQYQLTVTDAESESNDDGGKAMQVFWNNSPVKGIAILKPKNIDMVKDHKAKDAIYRIDYSEAGELGYDAHMTVSISGLPFILEEDDRFAMSSLKMFAGKKGDLVEVYGNSNHPNAAFFTEDTGFNWAFVAAGNDTEDVGVAEVGLPPSTLSSTSRAEILVDYSIKNVFETQIQEAFPGIDQNTLDAYLANTNAPGFFNDNGFVIAGTRPGDGWIGVEAAIGDLTPFSPSEVSNLEVTFKD